MYIITGGGTGLGQALAINLASKGSDVLIMGRRESLLASTARLHKSIDYICVDVTRESDYQKILEKIAKKPVHGLVNNAGIINPIVPINQMSKENWRQFYATNVDSVLFLTNLLLPKLKGGRVLNIGTGAAYIPIKGWSGYCTSKAALALLTRCFQVEIPHTKFASVMPGIIDTAMQEYIRASKYMDDKKIDFFKSLEEKKGLLKAHVVAEFLSWILLLVNDKDYDAKEWDIYDTSHHKYWLKPGFEVPLID